MTAPTTDPDAPRAPTGPAAPAALEFVVTVRDDVDARIAGHHGGSYTSPPQPHEQALALAALLGAGAAAGDGRGRWTVAVPGGRRTITLTPAHGPAPGPAVPRAGGTQRASEAHAAQRCIEDVATRSEP